MEQTIDLFNEVSSGAEFSTCRKYRYALWRRWHLGKKVVMFIGLNPSTANESTDDPTIRKVIKFGKDWGYGGICMVNLFSYITPYPSALVADDDFENNLKTIQAYYDRCGDVVFAWGRFEEAKERSEVITSMFPKAYALGVNKDLSPKHPLYIPSHIEPKLYSSLANTLIGQLTN